MENLYLLKILLKKAGEANTYPSYHPPVSALKP